MEITKEEFLRYEKVRVSGITNMFDIPLVSVLTDLPKEKILYIMVHYTELKQKYMDENARREISEFRELFDWIREYGE